MSWLLALLLWPASVLGQAGPLLVVDLSEAYARSSALAQLLRDVDGELQAITARHRPALLALRAELRVLKEQGDQTREAQLRLARRINEIESAAQADEERLAAANQAAIAQVDAAIAAVKATLGAERGARAVLDIQEVQYVRPDCECLATARLYELLNARLPSVALGLEAPAGS